VRFCSVEVINREKFRGFELEKGILKTSYKSKLETIPADCHTDLLLTSQGFLHFKLELPSQIKKDLKLIQIENTFSSQLEGLGFVPGNYTYFYREQKHFKKAMLDIDLFVYPNQELEELDYNRLFILPDIFYTLVKRMKPKDDVSYMFVHVFEDNAFFACFRGTHLLRARVVSGFTNLEGEIGITNQLLRDRHGFLVPEKNIFVSGVKTESFQTLDTLFEREKRLKIFKKKMEVFFKSKEVPHEFVILFLVYALGLKPVRVKDPVSVFIDGRVLKRASIVLGGLFGLGIATIAGEVGMIKNLNSQKELLNLELSSLKPKLQKLKAELGKLTRKLESEEIKVIKNMNFPLIIETYYAVRKLGKIPGIEIIYMQLEGEDKVKLGVVAKTPESIEELERRLELIPTVVESKYTILFKAENGYFVNYEIGLGKATYGEAIESWKNTR
jgi:hypothetical protein